MTKSKIEMLLLTFLFFYAYNLLGDEHGTNIQFKIYFIIMADSTSYNFYDD